MGLDPIVYVSSWVALIGQKGAVLTPDSPITRPPGAYYRSKADSDLVARCYRNIGAPVVITYPGMVWGPQRPPFRREQPVRQEPAHRGSSAAAVGRGAHQRRPGPGQTACRGDREGPGRPQLHGAGPQRHHQTARGGRLFRNGKADPCRRGTCLVPENAHAGGGHGAAVPPLPPTLELPGRIRAGSPAPHRRLPDALGLRHHSYGSGRDGGRHPEVDDLDGRAVQAAGGPAFPLTSERVIPSSARGKKGDVRCRFHSWAARE